MGVKNKKIMKKVNFGHFDLEFGYEGVHQSLSSNSKMFLQLNEKAVRQI